MSRVALGERWLFGRSNRVGAKAAFVILLLGIEPGSLASSVLTMEWLVWNMIGNGRTKRS